jgi:hypothetical protein
MGKYDLFARVAECDRALHVATDADRRNGLERLRNVWMSLLHDEQLVRDPGMEEAISILRKMHSKMVVTAPVLH